MGGAWPQSTGHDGNRNVIPAGLYTHLNFPGRLKITDNLGYTKNNSTGRERYIVVYDEYNRHYPYRIVDTEKCVTVSGTFEYSDARNLAVSYNDKIKG